MRLIDLLNGEGAMRALAGMKLPVRVAYRVSKSARLLQSRNGEYRDAEQVLLRQFGTLPEGSTSFEFEPGQMEAYQDACKNLQEQEISIPNLLTISLEDLGDREIEPAILMGLDGWFIADPVEMEAVTMSLQKSIRYENPKRKLCRPA